MLQRPQEAGARPKAVLRHTLAAMLGYTVECPLPEKCLYEMEEPEIKDLEACLRTQRVLVTSYLANKREGSG